MSNKILNYPGAKWRIADWIISHFPEHKTYVEPYAGSAAIFFRKEPSRIETINDIDCEVINLFECIRKDSEKLAFLVMNTPFSRYEYESSDSESGDDFERARKLLVRSWQSFGYRTNEMTGWKNDIIGREYAYAVKHWNRLPEVIFKIVDRLKQAQIECRPAIEVIKKYNRPGVLIYADPPYLINTRNRKQYKHEMTEQQEHIDLLNVLNQHQGSVILSGYNNELYNEMLSDWEKDSIQSNAQGGLHRIETIWIKKS